MGRGGGGGKWPAKGGGPCSRSGWRRPGHFRRPRRRGGEGAGVRTISGAVCEITKAGDVTRLTACDTARRSFWGRRSLDLQGAGRAGQGGERRREARHRQGLRGVRGRRLGGREAAPKHGAERQGGLDETHGTSCPAVADPAGGLRRIRRPTSAILCPLHCPRRSAGFHRPPAYRLGFAVLPRASTEMLVARRRETLSRACGSRGRRITRLDMAHIFLWSMTTTKSASCSAAIWWPGVSRHHGLRRARDGGEARHPPHRPDGTRPHAARASGLDLCRAVRARSRLPIILLTAMKEDVDASLALRSVPTTISASRSIHANWWRGCARSCAASRTASRPRRQPAVPLRRLHRRRGNPRGAHGGRRAGASYRSRI